MDCKIDDPHQTQPYCQDQSQHQYRPGALEMAMVTRIVAGYFCCCVEFFACSVVEVIRNRKRATLYYQRALAILEDWASTYQHEQLFTTEDKTTNTLFYELFFCKYFFFLHFGATIAKKQGNYFKGFIQGNFCIQKNIT